jgi:hypothetical protein
VRIICANTETAAIGRAKASFTIRHPGGARAAIQQARTALKLSWRYIEAFEAEAAALYAQAMSVDEVRHFAAKLPAHHQEDGHAPQGARDALSQYRHARSPRQLVLGGGEAAGYDESLDLVGTLEDLHDLGLAHVALDALVAGVAHAA